MKRLSVVVLLLLVVGLAGCTEFAGGFTAGAAVMKKMANDSQEQFIEAVNELNKETAKLNAQKEAVENIEVESFINPETIEAVQGLEEREKDPVTWIALTSVLANMFWGGKAFGGRK